MIAILSPAKTLNLEPNPLKEYTLPDFKDRSLELIKVLKKKNVSELKELMHISEKLSMLNVDRYQNFQKEFDLETSKQAILTFKGDVYLGLEANDFSKKELKIAQKSIRILSGLYGILKPLDLMQAYRLEMGTKLTTQKGKNLYEFWGEDLTENLKRELHSFKKPVLINLASKEYAKALQFDQLESRVIDIDFREYKGDKLRFVSFSAKKARGLMARYIVKNNVSKPNELKGFDLEDYSYSEGMSEENKWMFVR